MSWPLLGSDTLYSQAFVTGAWPNGHVQAFIADPIAFQRAFRESLARNPEGVGLQKICRSLDGLDVNYLAKHSFSRTEVWDLLSKLNRPQTAVRLREVAKLLFEELHESFSVTWIRLFPEFLVDVIAAFAPTPEVALGKLREWKNSEEGERNAAFWSYACDDEFPFDLTEAQLEMPGDTVLIPVLATNWERSAVVALSDRTKREKALAALKHCIESRLHPQQEREIFHKYRVPYTRQLINEVLQLPPPQSWYMGWSRKPSTISEHILWRVTHSG